jgi:hypothetical protein
VLIGGLVGSEALGDGGPDCVQEAERGEDRGELVDCERMAARIGWWSVSAMIII